MSKNHQPNEGSMSSSPRRILPCSRCPELSVAPVSWEAPHARLDRDWQRSVSKNSP
ncbi:hypothetical protein COCC4DRAFT_30462 [Bipolaris maydis ATCC 48331]|uniref:Uncharacterized protein n=3 Tax=Bipolaris TaxID=33194 RepID=M2UUG9_COCH5|nr:uncharacterized protein COCMIDRAFT_95243 [Bipolaris oryzae ATCC 44560]XP_014082648.1 uncharacterized protein COCC4DRAFT_30462 [Bipolaris maydis ATCC 48331]EMD91503.1 hypothetical protein COCHEDRAFT_1021477 [Bipolaris maydis C5]ENI08739.1 hypothetical protein COCC4DRAFT_30462 [Bipolaris maydis ATCC 48331]EUC45537.1 hypothetical protein COCMIDRAFT_95243 [Bipolaris oryzae ATCC 44560]